MGDTHNGPCLGRAVLGARQCLAVTGTVPLLEETSVFLAWPVHNPWPTVPHKQVAVGLPAKPSMAVVLQREQMR